MSVGQQCDKELVSDCFGGCFAAGSASASWWSCKLVRNGQTQSTMEIAGVAIVVFVSKERDTMRSDGSGTRTFGVETLGMLGMLDTPSEVDRHGDYCNGASVCISGLVCSTPACVVHQGRRPYHETVIYGLPHPQTRSAPGVPVRTYST
jgi:hypothetical protein